MAWSLPFFPEPYQVWHSSQVETGSNYVGFVNEEADQICEDARLEFDHEARIKLYHRFHEIVHEEQPYTFLMSQQQPHAVGKRFENVRTYASGFDVREWWVTKANQRYQTTP